MQYFLQYRLEMVQYFAEPYLAGHSDRTRSKATLQGRWCGAARRGAVPERCGEAAAALGETLPKKAAKVASFPGQLLWTLIFGE